MIISDINLSDVHATSTKVLTQFNQSNAAFAEEQLHQYCTTHTRNYSN